MFLTPVKKRAIRRELMYGVIVEDFLEVFGYGPDTDEYKKFHNLMTDKNIDDGIEKKQEE